MVRTVADQFAEVLAAAGVKRIYGIVGDVRATLTALLPLLTLKEDGTHLAQAPPSITVEIAKGFTLYMVKAILSGKGDEVIDLARTNLWR
jgi:hypothetical protein